VGREAHYTSLKGPAMMNVRMDRSISVGNIISIVTIIVAMITAWSVNEASVQSLKANAQQHATHLEQHAIEIRALQLTNASEMSDAKYFREAFAEMKVDMKELKGSVQDLKAQLKQQTP
jgi:peptidoglycan hydrolase CwlO-like protein